MTRRDAIYAAAFALAARHCPIVRFVDHDDGRCESRPLTPAERHEHCAREADAAVALLDAWEAK